MKKILLPIFLFVFALSFAQNKDFNLPKANQNFVSL
jgi:hypothetical protein